MKTSNLQEARNTMSKKIRVAIAGLGSRGKDTYAKCAHLFPEEMEIVAIADIDPAKVQEAKEEYNVPEEMCFESAEKMLEQDKLADVMFICTMDRQHYGHAVPALKKGYDLLLEKPISPDLNECKEIAELASSLGRQVVVCHVLRYTPFYQKLKDLLVNGAVGDIVSIQAIENVGYWHQAHSFVRGNWRNKETSSPMILQKSCHDMDILLWLAGKACKSVSSFGALRLFREDKAPAGAGMRCLECDPETKAKCAFDAEKIYLTNKRTGILAGNTGWPCDVLALSPTEEKIRKAIAEGPYGRCVFHCDNNVVDHQVVTMELEDDTTIDFTMCAFTNRGSRHIRIMGTEGEIMGDMSAKTISVLRWGEEEELIDVSKLSEDFSGHGGGDNRLVKDILDLASGNVTGRTALTSIEKSTESHFVALAAEESRVRGGEVIRLEEFVK